MARADVWHPYCGAAPDPAAWLLHWNLDPWLLLAVGLGLYWWNRVPANHRSASAAYAALALFAILYVSPFCALGSALFIARVTHHVLLAVALAPLVALAFGLQHRRLPGSIALWTALQTAIFWAWHWPPLYAAALSNDLIFWAMQASITAAAVGFWVKVLRASSLGAIAALLATMIQMGVLGALITFAPSALYAPHWSSTAAWGLAPLEDQQIAGLVMWAPAAAAYLLAALAIGWRAIGGQPTR
ncbi:MAG: cytochrome c oxidase assembly protein [Pseudomonadota bacterium]|nr:cytochrome c oxidase assembly protein [Pseudomonadota bacterium]